MTIELCPPPPMSSYSIQVMANLQQAVQVLQNAQIFLLITKLDQGHHPHQDALLSFTTLCSCRITLYTPHQMPPPTCTLGCHPNPPDSPPAACSGIPALVLCGTAPLPSVPPPLPASDAGPSLEAKGERGSGEPPHTKCDSKGQFFPESYSDFSQPTRC